MDTNTAADRGALSPQSSDIAVARIGLYEHLSSGFGYPDEELAAQLRTGQYHRDVAAFLARVGSDSGEDTEHLDRCIEVLRALACEHTKMTLDWLQDEYQQVFGHGFSRDCPPYETEYARADAFQQSQELADIGGFYRAFGLEVDAAAHERLDYIAVEI